jgi:hypothetical protein
LLGNWPLTKVKRDGAHKRAVAICGVEHHALGGEAAQIRQFDGRRAVERQHWRGHLIGHDEKNVLALHVIAAFHSGCLCESAAIEDGTHSGLR